MKKNEKTMTKYKIQQILKNNILFIFKNSLFFLLFITNICFFYIVCNNLNPLVEQTNFKTLSIFLIITIILSSLTICLNKLDISCNNSLKTLDNLKHSYYKIIKKDSIKEIKIKSSYQRSKDDSKLRKRTLYSLDVLNDLDKLIKDAGINKHGIRIDNLEHIVLKNKNNEIQINLNPETVKSVLKIQNSEYRDEFSEFAESLEKQEQDKLSK